MEPVTRESRPLPPRLSLWDATSLIIGIIIGVGIYKTPALIFSNVAGPWEALSVWLFCGILSIIGALCFAELASTYPRSGGEYVYLSRAYGSWVGFLFAWAQLTIIRTGGGIAAVAYVFADYATTLWNLGPGSTVIYAVAAIVGLTGINILGVNPGRWAQNALTVAKIIGLGGIVLAGFLAAAPPAIAAPPTSLEPSFALAMLLAFYTYDGWNEAAYVAAEVRDQRRTLPQALILGTVLVMVIYLLINAAFLTSLGFSAAASSNAIAADVLTLSLGESSGKAMSVLVMVSALGAMHGTIFTGSRIYREMGTDYRAFTLLGRWNQRLGTPVWSLMIQAAICIGMVLAVAAWYTNTDDFEAILKCTSVVFWMFFLLTGLSLIVLRRKDRDVERPFRVPGYPVLPLVFCLWCAYMVYGSFIFAPKESLVGVAILLAGLPLYFLPRPARTSDAPREKRLVAVNQALSTNPADELRRRAA